MKLYTVAQVREAERLTETEYGIPLSVLMDNAGRCLAQTAVGMLPDATAVIGIFCGSGNNGGDGYVCGATLLQKGRKVMLWGVGVDKLQPGSLAKNAAKAYVAAGGEIQSITYELSAPEAGCGLIVDALLGTGLTRPVSDLYAHVIGLINEFPAPVLSCDVPSGVDADTGRIMGASVKADKTLIMGMAKKACRLSPGMEMHGE